MITLLLHLLRLLPFSRRRPSPARPREPGPALAARHLQANAGPPHSSARLTACSGPAWPESGPVGGRRWSSSRLTLSCAGSAAASASTGPGSRAAQPEGARPSTPRSPTSSGRWLPPILSGAPCAFMVGSRAGAVPHRARLQPPPHRTARTDSLYAALLPASRQGLCDLSAGRTFRRGP
jgi:hypothetical protein